MRGIALAIIIGASFLADAIRQKETHPADGFVLIVILVVIGFGW